MAWQLYLPEIWAEDPERRAKAKVPDEVVFQTKIQTALQQIRAALAAQTPDGIGERRLRLEHRGSTGAMRPRAINTYA